MILGVSAVAAAAIPLLACIESNRRTGSADGSADGVADSGGGDVGGETGQCSGGCIVADACRTIGERNPLNACEACDPARNAEGWSPVAGEVACFGGNARCVVEGVCVAGNCEALLPDVCQGLPPCVDSVRCDRAGCTPEVARTTCFIDGACHGDGEGPADDPCRVCDAGKDQLAWSFTSAECDDGDACSVEDRCAEGVCSGQDKACLDDLDCTLDYCDGGTCRHDVSGDACLLEEGCFDDGDRAPDRPCLVCAPQRSQTAWSALPVGALCDDGDSCSSVSRCSGSGACSGPWDDVDEEPNDAVAQPQYLEDIGIPLAYPSGTVEGNLTSGQDRDIYQWDMTFPASGVIDPKVELELDVAMPVALCLYARCGTNNAFAASVSCPALTYPDQADLITRGCCTSVTTKEKTLQISPSCGATPMAGTVLAAVVALDAVEGGSCGGYSFAWGAVP